MLFKQRLWTMVILSLAFAGTSSGFPINGAEEQPATKQVTPTSAGESKRVAQDESMIVEILNRSEVNQAYKLMLSDNRVESELAFNNALLILGPDNPMSAVVYSGRGTLNFMHKEYARALEDFSRALGFFQYTDREFSLIKESPNLNALMNACLNGRFICNLLTEHYADALVDDQKLAAWKPENVTSDSHVFRGYLHALSGDSAGAIAEFDQADASGKESKTTTDGARQLCFQLQTVDEKQRELVRNKISQMLRAKFEPGETGTLIAAAADKSRDAAIRSNMRTLQVALEMYATEHGGMYPGKLEQDFDQFVQKNGFKVWPMRNPFTGNEEPPIAGAITSVQDARAAKPVHMTPGHIEYSSIGGGTGYAIRGGGHDGMALAGPGGKSTTLVLSNE